MFFVFTRLPTITSTFENNWREYRPNCGLIAVALNPERCGMKDAKWAVRAPLETNAMHDAR